MGVMMEAFYWNCPTEEKVAGKWWSTITSKLSGLKQVGFTALWLPPVSKAAGTGSMGYDPYDYYDLGEFNQKGGVATLFGDKQDLLKLVAAAHAKPYIQLYADLVLNHNSGADSQEVNPIDGKTRWTKFTPASKVFGRDCSDFHPCAYESWDGYQQCGEMPDLCHRNPRVYEELLKYAKWLVEKVGFDGFRYDMVKGYGPWFIGAIQEYRYKLGANGSYFKPFGVGEYWDSDAPISAWLAQANIENDNPVSAFDFPLRDRLKNLCDTYGYDLRDLAAPGVLYKDCPIQAVTFVENHDVAEPHDNPNPIVNNKMLAYAFILTHEGYPCVFWKDYFNYGLAQVGYQSGIAALVGVHENLDPFMRAHEEG
jgi:alpha-amylase